MSAREWIFVAVAVLAVYLVFQLIRAMQVRDPADEATDDEDEQAFDELATELPVAADEDDEADDAGDADGGPEALPAEEGFALALEVRQLRRDIAQLRDELDAQRGELESVRGMLQSQAGQIEATRAAQRVSPIYGEALSMAQRGLGADIIAERCGISVAEAELVQSLAQDSTASGETS